MILVKLDNITLENAELVAAMLTESENEGWQEKEGVFEVYFKEELWHQEQHRNALFSIAQKFGLDVEEHQVDDINWNEQWEKDYEPVFIGDQVYIKTFFHPEKKFPYTIIIHPKMSFGTGHHATTRLMCSMILELNCEDKRVVDIGTGTGILAILAKMRGADYVLATDNDVWCYENTLENIVLNGMNGIEVRLSGDIEEIKDKYDIIIANIHRNYQLENMVNMFRMLNENGYLLISGFYEEDALDLLNLAQTLPLYAQSIKTDNKWCAICFKKI